MGVDCRLIIGNAYVIPKEYVKQAYKMLLCIMNELDDEYQEERAIFYDGFNPEMHPMAIFTKIEFNREIYGTKDAESVCLEEYEERPELPEIQLEMPVNGKTKKMIQKFEAFVKKHGVYGNWEFWNFT